MAAVSAAGSMVWVSIRLRNSSYKRSMALVVRANFHWLGGQAKEGRRRSPASSRLVATPGSANAICIGTHVDAPERLGTTARSAAPRRCAPSGCCWILKEGQQLVQSLVWCLFCTVCRNLALGRAHPLPSRARFPARHRAGPQSPLRPHSASNGTSTRRSLSASSCTRVNAGCGTVVLADGVARRGIAVAAQVLLEHGVAGGAGRLALAVNVRAQEERRVGINQPLPAAVPAGSGRTTRNSG